MVLLLYVLRAEFLICFLSVFLRSMPFLLCLLLFLAVSACSLGRSVEVLRLDGLFSSAWHIMNV